MNNLIEFGGANKLIKLILGKISEKEDVMDELSTDDLTYILLVDDLINATTTLVSELANCDLYDSADGSLCISKVNGNIIDFENGELAVDGTDFTFTAYNNAPSIISLGSDITSYYDYNDTDDIGLDLQRIRALAYAITTEIRDESAKCCYDVYGDVEIANTIILNPEKVTCQFVGEADYTYDESTGWRYYEGYEDDRTIGFAYIYDATIQWGIYDQRIEQSCKTFDTSMRITVMERGV